MSPIGRRRLTHLALALGTILIGLAIHFGSGMLSSRARDVAGDALWAAMIVWWVGALAPGAPPSIRYVIAYAICVLVEISQAFHSPSLDAIRANRVGQLILGSGFDARDLLAYALGVGAAALVDTALVGRTGIHNL